MSDNDVVQEPQFDPEKYKCTQCGRERTIGDPAHPHDFYDYNPIQAITGQPFGWYDGTDANEGQICPECFTKIYNGANGL